MEHLGHWYLPKLIIFFGFMTRITKWCQTLQDIWMLPLISIWDLSEESGKTELPYNWRNYVTTINYRTKLHKKMHLVVTAFTLGSLKDGLKITSEHCKRHKYLCISSLLHIQVLGSNQNGTGRNRNFNSFPPPSYFPSFVPFTSNFSSFHAATGKERKKENTKGIKQNLNSIPLFYKTLGNKTMLCGLKHQFSLSKELNSIFICWKLNFLVIFQAGIMLSSEDFNQTGGKKDKQQLQ